MATGLTRRSVPSGSSPWSQGKNPPGQLGLDSLVHCRFPLPSDALYCPERVTTADPAGPGDTRSPGLSPSPTADLCLLSMSICPDLEPTARPRSPPYPHRKQLAGAARRPHLISISV